jgi:hypothetical protein
MGDALMQVPDKPRVVSLQRLTVGQPASASAITRWNEDLAFLTSYVAQPVCSVSGISTSTTPHSYYVAYTKTPGTKALRVAIELQQSASGTSPSLTCEITCPTGTINYCDVAPLLWADASRSIDTTAETMRDYASPNVPNTIDVSQLTDGTTYDLKFTVTDTSGTAGITRGLFRIHVVECPLANVDPIGAPTTETGVNGAWLTNTDRNAIVDGTDSTVSYGMRRLMNQVAIARAQKRRQMQCVRPESTSLGWSVTADGASPTTAFPFGFSGAPVFRVRAPALYGTTTASLWTLRLRYINSAGNKLKFRVAVTPVGGATTNHDFTLANSATWTAASVDTGAVSMSVSIPSSGTNQEADIQFFAVNDTAATTTQVSQIYLVSAEV